MKLNDIFKILGEEGIKKEELKVERCGPYEEKRYKDWPATVHYRTKENKRRKYLFLDTYADEPKRSTDFKFILIHLDVLFRQVRFDLIKLHYKKGILEYYGIDPKFREEDVKTFFQLKKPTTPEEEVEFIKQVIKIYKGDL